MNSPKPSSELSLTGTPLDDLPPGMSPHAYAKITLCEQPSDAVDRAKKTQSLFDNERLNQCSTEPVPVSRTDHLSRSCRIDGDLTTQST